MLLRLCASAFCVEGLSWREVKRGFLLLFFLVSGHGSLKGCRNIIILPFVALWGNFETEGQQLKKHQTFLGKCHIRSKTPPFTRNYLQAAEPSMTRAQVILYGVGLCFPKNTSHQRADGGSSRPAHSVNDRSWWAPISSSGAVKKKAWTHWKAIPVVRKTYTSSQTLAV